MRTRMHARMHAGHGRLAELKCVSCSSPFALLVVALVSYRYRHIAPDGTTTRTAWELTDSTRAGSVGGSDPVGITLLLCRLAVGRFSCSGIRWKESAAVVGLGICSGRGGWADAIGHDGTRHDGDGEFELHLVVCVGGQY